MATERKLLGSDHGYTLYEISDGCVEGWRKGERFLSNAKDVEGFFTQFPKKDRKKAEKKEVKPEEKK